MRYSYTPFKWNAYSFVHTYRSELASAQVNGQTYAYTPFGSVTANGDITQPIQWSSEYYDSELALVYYNYCHYNSTDGRWINRDPIAEQGGRNLYGFVGNKLKAHVVLGLDAPGYEGAQAITIIIDIQEKSRRIDRNHILGLPKGGWSLGITDLIPDFIESINNRIHNNFF